MAINKVVYGNNTLLDLTSDTVTSDKLIRGITAHNKSGNNITGTLVVQQFIVTSEEPTDSDGDDNDICFIIQG